MQVADVACSEIQKFKNLGFGCSLLTTSTLCIWTCNVVKRRICCDVSACLSVPAGLDWPLCYCGMPPPPSTNTGALFEKNEMF